MFGNIAFSQEDTTKIEISEEVIEGTFWEKVDEKYNYIIRSKVEEKTLIKAGFSNFYYSNVFSKRYFGGINASVEQKIWPSLTVLAEAIVFYKGHRSYKSWYEDFFLGVHDEREYQMNIAMRYYYNMKNRMASCECANNFSVDYISLQLDYIYEKYYYNPKWVTITNYDSNDPYPDYIKKDDYNYRLSLTYGIQRRIGKYFYMDFKVGPLFYPEDNTFDLVNIDYSFGFGF